MQRIIDAPIGRRLGILFLLGALFGAPLLAGAALAPYDLSGKTRATPTTIGAVEVDSGATRPAAPTGLTVTPLR